MTGSGIPALFSDYRGFAGSRLWLAFALMMLGALAEGFGLLMLVPIAAFAISSTSRSSMAPYVPFGTGWTSGQWLALSLGLFIAAMAARALLLFARDLLLARLQAEYEADLRLRAAVTLAGRGWPFAGRIGQDGMQALLLTDVPRAAQASAHLQNLALAAAMLSVQLALALFLSPALAAVTVGFLLIGGLFSARVAARGVRTGVAISDSMEESAASGFRLHAGLKAALAQGTTGAFLAEYRATLAQSARHYGRFARNHSASRQLTGLGAAVVAAILLLIGVQVLSLPLPVLVASLALFARMNAPAQMLQNNALQAAAYAPSFAAIERRLGRLEGAGVIENEGQPRRWSRLALDRIGYHHANGRGLDAVSLDLRAGEWLGIAGASGAGKTTLIDLIAGLLAPQSGTMVLDGQPLAGSTLAGWQRSLAYVGQDGALFSGSVRRNLLAEGSPADEAGLWRALDTVGLTERIRAFPNGLDHGVGDRGSQLSGGERQRLVLARALLRKPSLLILDEATAALDAAGETALIHRLRALDPRPSALVIAHRPTTLAHCDSRVAIQHGAVRAEDAVFADETTSARINVAGAIPGGKE